MNIEQVNLVLSEIAEEIRMEAINLAYDDMVRELENLWLEASLHNIESEWD